MRILHFVGEGKGFMARVKEYIIITDEDESPIEDWVAPGFKLDSETEVEDLPTSLPLNTTLAPCQ